VSDPSTPWLVAAYTVAFVLLGGYSLRLLLAKRRTGRNDAPGSGGGAR
jgi:CcmD family protein